jgi:predicted Zn-dependent protease
MRKPALPHGKSVIFSFPMILAAILLYTTGCVTLEENPVSGNRRAFAYTWEQEIQIGRQADQDIISQFGIYENDELTKYINQLSELVLAQSHMRREDTSPQFRETEFTFRVLNSDIVNAFALPGGYVYFTRGLLAHMNNEAQLAVVIGHEIGHVAARHASQRILQQQAGQLILVGGAIAGQELFGVSAESILNIGGTTAQLLFLSYSRDNERESDRLGVEYSAMAGFDASEGAAFFRTLQRLSERAGATLPNHLSSHPDPGDRERSMITLSQQWKDRGYEQTRRNERQYMEMIDGMVLGQNPREGFVQDGQFVHPELAFQYPVPAGWRVQNQPRQVVLFDQEQQGISIFTFAGGVSNAREAVEKFTSQEGINQISASRADVHGNPGYRAVARGTMQDGTELQFLVQGIEYGGNIFRFINYSTTARYENYEPRFLEIVNGFRQLTDQSILDIQPVRIEVVTANRTGSFESFLPAEMPMGMDKEEMAILNQLRLSDTVTRGQRLKLPRQ